MRHERIGVLSEELRDEWVLMEILPGSEYRSSSETSDVKTDKWFAVNLNFEIDIRILRKETITLQINV